MTTPVWRLRSVRLEAFRAYLQPCSFDLAEKPGLAIFAPNACGKSSLIDALELLLAPDDLLGRLGQKEQGNDPGPRALAHVGARSGQSPTVTVTLDDGGTDSTATLKADDPASPAPASIAALRAAITVSPVIRGWQLRGFVHEHSPADRYRLIAGWLGLDRLARLQDDLAALRRDFERERSARIAQQRAGIDRELADLTRNTARTWDEPAILAWINGSLLPPVDPGLQLAALDPADPAITRIEALAQAEAHTIGLDLLQAQRRAAAAVATGVTSDVPASGALPAFEAALEALEAARTRERAAHAAAANAVFAHVWEAAQPLFADDATAPAACPVCATPLDRTVLGGVAAIRDHLARHLAELAAWKDARDALTTAERTAAARRDELRRALQTLRDLLGDDREALRDQVERFEGALEVTALAAPPEATALTKALAALLEELDRKIEAIVARQGASSAIAARDALARLQVLASGRRATDRLGDELAALAQKLATMAATIGRAAADQVGTRLDRLRRRMNDVYAAIQGDKAVPIRLDPPDDDARETRRLDLLIEFAANSPALRPAGYLSDSQLHSLALAFRLAAIEQRNPQVPILALDDIVTSYDADHRRTIAQLIATRLAGFQIVLVSHDERFVAQLREVAGDAAWRFERIIGIEPGIGPRFARMTFGEERLQELWDDGRSAANEMRILEEEWLVRICRDLVARLPLRPPERPHGYKRAELACALAARLKELGVSPPPVAGVTNPFMRTLQSGTVENFGSHFSDDPNASPSIGDEKARWQEFSAFRGAFVCRDGACGHDRVTAAGSGGLLCRKCRKPIDLESPPAAGLR